MLFQPFEFLLDIVVWKGNGIIFKYPDRPIEPGPVDAPAQKVFAQALAQLIGTADIELTIFKL